MMMANDPACYGTSFRMTVADKVTGSCSNCSALQDPFRTCRSHCGQKRRYSGNCYEFRHNQISISWNFCSPGLARGEW